MRFSNLVSDKQARSLIRQEGAQISTFGFTILLYGQFYAKMHKIHTIYTEKYKNILVRSGGVVKITDFQKDSSLKIMTLTLLSLNRSQILWYFKQN